MKKKGTVILLAVLLVLAILFVPIPRGTMKDGGTRDWKALTYRLVSWNRLTGGGDTYSATRFYFGTDAGKSLDDLWKIEWDGMSEEEHARFIRYREDGRLTEEPVTAERRTEEPVTTPERTAYTGT